MTSSTNPAAPGHGRSQHRPSRSWRPYPRTTTRAAPHIRARRSRQPARPSRSAEHPPDCLACTARQGQLPGGSPRLPSMIEPLRDRIPRPDRDTSRRAGRPRRLPHIPQRHKVSAVRAGLQSPDMPGRWLLPLRGRQPAAAKSACPAHRPAACHNRRICAQTTGQSIQPAQANTRRYTGDRVKRARRGGVADHGVGSPKSSSPSLAPRRKANRCRSARRASVS